MMVSGYRGNTTCCWARWFILVVVNWGAKRCELMNRTGENLVASDAIACPIPWFILPSRPLFHKVNTAH